MAEEETAITPIDSESDTGKVRLHQFYTCSKLVVFGFLLSPKVYSPDVILSFLSTIMLFTVSSGI